MNWFLLQLLLEYFMNLRKNVFKICCTLILPFPRIKLFPIAYFVFQWLAIQHLSKQQSCPQLLWERKKIIDKKPNYSKNWSFFFVVCICNRLKCFHSKINLPLLKSRNVPFRFFLSSNCFVSLHFLVIFPLNEPCLKMMQQENKNFNYIL